MKFLNMNVTHWVKSRTMKVLCSIILIAVLGSCTKFLEERPSKTTSLVVTTADQLDALLGSYSSYYSEGNRTNIYSTDDFGFTKEIVDARASTFSMDAVKYALWDIEYMPDVGRETFWSGEYGKIFRANMVLEYLDRVP